MLFIVLSMGGGRIHRGQQSKACDIKKTIGDIQSNHEEQISL